VLPFALRAVADDDLDCGGGWAQFVH
jgi:hypothetical protein